MCYPFFSLRDMQGIYRFGHESFSSLLFSYSAPVPGAPTDQTASQGTPDQKGCLGLGRSWKWNSSCPGLSKNPNWDSNCPSRDPNKPCLGTNLEYSGFHRDSIQVREAQTAKLRVKYRMRGRTQEKEIKKKKNRFLQPVPGIICTEKPERPRNSHTSCCLFMKHPPGEIIRLWVNKPLSRNTKNHRGSERLFRGPRKIY